MSKKFAHVCKLLLGTPPWKLKFEKIPNRDLREMHVQGKAIYSVKGKLFQIKQPFSIFFTVVIIGQKLVL